MFHRVTCVDCHTQSPETNTDQTLMSMLGWRISRRKLLSGEFVVEWRCPACWRKYKASLAAQPK